MPDEAKRMSQALFDALKEDDPEAHLSISPFDARCVIDGEFNLLSVVRSLITKMADHF